MPQHITETQVGTEKDGRLAEIIVLNYLGACSFSSAETKNQPFLVSFSWNGQTLHKGPFQEDQTAFF